MEDPTLRYISSPATHNGVLDYDPHHLDGETEAGGTDELRSQPPWVDGPGGSQGGAGRHQGSQG